MPWPIVGHERAVELLRQSLASGRVVQAYLLVGPPGVGKTTLATLLAKAVNCEGDDRPCGRCGQCVRVDRGVHPDVLVIRRGMVFDEDEESAGTRVGIGAVRQLIRDASLLPMVGRYRVFIILDAESMTVEAANALLKTLEEPPPHVLVILVAADDAALPETVRSRCLRVELRPVGTGRVAALLRERGVDPDRARLLAALGRGRVGRSLALAASDDWLRWRENLLDRHAGLVASGQTAAALRWAQELAEAFGRDRDQVLEALDVLADWWRDVLVIKAGVPDLVTNVDREAELRQVAGQLGIDDILRAVGQLRRARRLLEQNVHPRLTLDNLVLSLPALGAR